MGKIIILDELTTNKIAAGEVIERPASVVKEMAENSIDAGARSISIEIRNGGVSYIKVSDDGAGIEEDDAVIAFERHSTSKIRSADDLEDISTMGFRGEALASIAAVADVELTTHTLNATHGIQANVKGGRTMSVKEAGCPKGTTFIVRDLFYNTPARYKFLKKDATEAGYVHETITRLALGNPNVAFKLVDSGKTEVQTPGNGDLKSVIFSVFGRETVSGLHKIDYNEGPFKITGYAGDPKLARANRNAQFIYLNNRHIRSKLISDAIESAYFTLLMKGRFPFAVVHIAINPILADVNVHPAKLEARFSNEAELRTAVEGAIYAALFGQSGMREINGTVAGALIEDGGAPGSDIGVLHATVSEPGAVFTVTPVPLSKKTPLPAQVSISEFEEPPKLRQQSINTGNVIAASDFEKFIYIGQIFNTYAILQSENEMILMDQHAAHERVIFDEIKAKYDSEGDIAAQMLLVPEIVTLTPHEFKIASENAVMLGKLGFDTAEFGQNTMIVRSIPLYNEGCDIKELFIGIVDELINTARSENSGKSVSEAIYMIACKAAVKANMKLDALEIANLTSDLSKLENPFTCPHGRPVIVRITKRELEKMFKRIV